MASSTKNRRSSEYYAKIGRLGGMEVVNRYSTEYMSLIGKLGANTTNGQTMSKTALLRTQRAARRIIRENQAI